MRDVHAREDEAGADRLTVGSVAEADGLRAALTKPGDQLSERLGLAVRPRPSAHGTALSLSFKGGAVLEHQRLRPNRQHVLAASLIEPRAQLTPAAIVEITEHRHPPGRRAPDPTDCPPETAASTDSQHQRPASRPAAQATYAPRPRSGPAHTSRRCGPAPDGSSLPQAPRPRTPPAAPAPPTADQHPAQPVNP